MRRNDAMTQWSITGFDPCLVEYVLHGFIKGIIREGIGPVDIACDCTGDQLLDIESVRRRCGNRLRDNAYIEDFDPRRKSML